MVCRSSGNVTMKHGVDIVRSALQALHTHAAGTEGRQQCCGNCSFSGAAADCTDQQPWDRSLHVQMLLSQIGYTFIISVDVVQVPYWSCKKFFFLRQLDKQIFL